MNFRKRFLQRGRETGAEQLKLVIFLLMQHNFSEILKYVAVCKMYCFESS